MAIPLDPLAIWLGTMSGTHQPDPSQIVRWAKYIQHLLEEGVHVLPAVDLATTGNITLSGEQSIDGTLTSTSRVLVKDQTNTAQNGIYVTASGAWARAADASTAAELSMVIVAVLGGSTLASTVWRTGIVEPSGPVIWAPGASDAVVTAIAEYLDDALALKANSADLAPVATSGDYDDLTNLPTLGSAAAEDAAAFASAAQGARADSAVQPAALAALAGTVDAKADQSAVEALQDALAGKADQGAVDSLQEDLATRAPADHTHGLSAVTGLQAALEGKAPAADLMATDARTIHAPDRPGDNPGAFSATLTGAGAGKAPLTDTNTARVPGAGLCQVLTGAGVIALRNPVALGRDVWQVTARLRRLLNPADPNNHAISLRVAWLDAAMDLLGLQTLLTRSDALTASGTMTLSARLSALDVKGVIAPPPGAVYACPYLQTYGEDGATAVETLRAAEITDLALAEIGNLSGLVAEAQAAIDAANAASLVATETLDTMAAVAGYTRPGNVGVISLKGGYAAGDGFGGQWAYDPTDTTSASAPPAVLVGADGARYKPSARLPTRFSTVDALAAFAGALPEGWDVEASGHAYRVASPAAGDAHLMLPGGTGLYLPTTPLGLPIDALRAETTKELFEAAARIAQGYAYGDNSFGAGEQRMVNIILRPGAVYDLGALTVDFGSDIRDINIICPGGRATIRGTGKGLGFSRIRNLTFSNINFVGFTVATEWSTTNIDSGLVHYDSCWFIDCALGVETVSYAASRSTVLVFTRPRSGRTRRLVTSYCDMLIFNDGHLRNGDPSGAFVYADSQVIVNGGIWTPYEKGAAARWFDLDNRHSSAFGSRSFSANGARFGPEGEGGIPVIYSWLSGNTDNATRTTMTHISINDCYSGSANAETPQGLIVLRSNDAGTATLAPNSISIRGGSHNAGAGAVVTEAGLPIGLDVGEFVIDIDAAAQARWGNEVTAPNTPLVASSLEKYVAEWRIEGRTITDTGTIAPSVGSRRVIRPNPASATELLDLTDALDGHIVTMIFRNSNVTVRDQSNGGAFDLAGSVDFVGSNHSTLTVVYDRASGRWKEVSSSVN